MNLTKKNKMIFAMSKIFKNNSKFTDIVMPTIEKFKELFPDWEKQYKNINESDIRYLIQCLNLNDTKESTKWQPNDFDFYIFKDNNGRYYKYDKNKDNLTDFPAPKEYYEKSNKYSEKLESFNKELSTQNTIKENDILKEFSKNPNELRKIISRTSNTFERSVAISSWIKLEAKGRCMNCKEMSFKNNQNNYYMECHHIVPLSEGGKDSINNVIALCANCHRKAHFEKNKTNLYKEIFLEKVKKLKP